MKKAYFISDAHLGARYIKDKREHEGRLVRFLNSIKDDVSELYLLGDILDYWFEYRYVVPRGHIRWHHLPTREWKSTGSQAITTCGSSTIWQAKWAWQ